MLFTGGGTGGHLDPALAIARALVRERPDVEPHFVGAQRGIERDVLPHSGFPHTLLDLHPLYRRAPWKSWKTVTSLVQGVRAVAELTRDHAPSLVVATGGYASGATLAYALSYRVPYVIQEQNATPGATVRWFSRWASEVFVGFPEAIDLLPRGVRARCVALGNPIEPPPVPRPDRVAARVGWGFGSDVRYVVLAFGGSQGSAALNALVDSWITRGLPDSVGLIWGTGKSHYDRYAPRESRHVRVRPFLAPIAEAYAAADIAVARAGAMTTAELCAWGIPMFLVPLPTAAADHQTVNAKALAQAGAAMWVPEREADAAAIDQYVRRMTTDYAQLATGSAAALSRAVPDAAAQIARRLVSQLPDARSAARAV